MINHIDIANNIAISWLIIVASAIMILFNMNNNIIIMIHLFYIILSIKCIIMNIDSIRTTIIL